jgi:hypothetical protein
MSDKKSVPSLPVYEKPVIRMDAKIPDSVMKSTFPTVPKNIKNIPKKRK